MSTDREVEVDVAIIGGGTAGSNAARAAVRSGAERVVLIHLPSLLNTCVESGCMPSKSLLASSKVQALIVTIQ